MGSADLNKKKSGKQRIKDAQYTDLYSLAIDDSGESGNGTWAWAVNQPWCTGYGNSTHPYKIEEISITNAEVSNALSIKNSEKHFIIQNSTISNGIGRAVWLENTQNGQLTKNSIYNNTWEGIYMKNCSNIRLTENEITHQDLTGVLFYRYNHNNTFSNNSVSHNKYGFYAFQYCNSNRIEDNVVFNNREDGIYLGSLSNNNSIVNNVVYNNSDDGIKLEQNSFCEITQNKVYNNSHDGLDLHIYNSTIASNEIYNNEGNGIYSYTSEQIYDVLNVIFNNTIANNSNIGIRIETPPNDDYLNLIYQNQILSNIQNSFNQGGINYWDNGEIGNKWSDYEGNDKNDDGIGNSSYQIGGDAPFNYDFNPIYEDGDDTAAPNITIIKPVQNQICGLNAPNYQVSVDGLYINSTHYELSGIEGNWNKTISKNSGTISQALWDEFGNGSLTLRFYVNDSLGNQNMDEIQIQKDMSVPNISINYPSNFTIFGNNSPEYNVSSEDPNLDTRWYNLNNGKNYTFTENTGNINQTAWNACENGTIFIKFYVNDSAGNLGTACAKIYKDNAPPNIIIENPTSGMVFGNTTLNFSIDIQEAHLNYTWYILNNSQQYFFENFTSPINASLWNSYGNGTLELIFFANDSLGNLAQKNMTIRKDTAPPELSIINPQKNHIYGNGTIAFNLGINEGNINTSWYLINSKQYFFMGTSGIINPTEWNNCPNGSIEITFFVNDSVSNKIQKSINIFKDSIQPNLTIITPNQNELMGILAPNYSIVVNERNLDKIWYRLNDSMENQFFTENGTLDQDEWDKLKNGTALITFFANDTVNNSINKSLELRIDKIDPKITIISPRTNDTFYNPPSFILEVEEYNIEKMWYTLNSSIQKYFFVQNDSIDSGTWDTFNDGHIEVHFYANDSAGNINFTSIWVIKDTNSPLLIVNSPEEGAFFGASAPEFEIFVFDSTLNTTWYTLNGGEKIIFTQNGTINENTWNNLLDGYITLAFYANDSAGRISNEIREIIKDTTHPLIQINNPLPFSTFADEPPILDILVFDLSFKSANYSIQGGESFQLNVNSTTIIDTGIWNGFNSGMILIEVFLDDSLGYKKNTSFHICKDVDKPIITINDVEKDRYGSNSPEIVVEIEDPRLYKTWFTINKKEIHYSLNGEQIFSQQIWESLSEGSLTITIYANDTAGNLNWEEITIIKDLSQDTSSKEENNDDGDKRDFFIWLSVILGFTIGIAMIIFLLKKKGIINLEFSGM